MTRRDHVFRILAYGFVLLGMGLTGLEVAWPSVADDLDRSLGELGYVSLCFGGGYTVSTLTSGRLADRWSIGSLLLAGGAVAIFGLIALAAAPSWTAFLTAAALLGMSGGLIDAATNAFVAVRRGPREMGFIHGAFGIGAIGGPLLLTAFLATGTSWRAAFILLAVAETVYIGGLWRLARRIDVPTSHDRDPTTSPSLRSPTLVWSVVVFFVYSGVAAGAGLWAFTLLTEERGVGKTAGGIIVAGYWAAFTASRFVLGFVGERADPDRVLRWSAVATILGLGLFWWNPNPAIGVAALIFTGFAHGPIFPLEVQLTPVRFGAALTATVVGYEFAAATFGTAALPGITGFLVNVVGLDIIPPVLFFNAILIWGAIEALRIVSRDEVRRIAATTRKAAA
jgi:fucose permease